MKSRHLPQDSSFPKVRPEGPFVLVFTSRLKTFYTVPMLGAWAGNIRQL